jgi:hypothetical protein
MLVSSFKKIKKKHMFFYYFHLLQSFNYTPYLFYKKQFKTEIHCFCMNPCFFARRQSLASVDLLNNGSTLIFPFEKAVLMVPRLLLKKHNV